MTRSPKEKSSKGTTKQITTPIAVIGIGSIFPQARSTQEYWDNILRKIDTVTDIPESRWSIDEYYDPNPSAPDKTYCKRGAFIPDIDFDPMEFGLPPNILEVTDVSQLLGLVVARDALNDAGYGEDRDFDRSRTGCILGFVGTSSKLFTPLMTRLQYPVWEKVLLNAGLSQSDTSVIIEKIKSAYVNWEENSFPGAIGNVVSGRICNRFDLGGTNCVVDAACASSLAAVRMAVGELIEGRADMMLTGGIDTDNSINSYMCFSKTPAFSKKDNVRPFDAESGGMMVGEGMGMIMLKRLEDAERDGDTIYSVIKAIGTSSDGRYKSIYAPRASRQALAIRRAYEEAGFAPTTVGLIEAHGTGTMAGDPAEFEGLLEAFGEGNPRKQHIALGSVKSQIAHTKAAAGTASLIKTSLALHHKVLPPTINVTRPNPKLDIENTPFYLNTEARPWIRAADGTPRRAGVSSFGFGGTNFHVVLEEYTPEHNGAYRLSSVAQPVLLWAESPEKLLDACREAQQTLQGDSAAYNFVNLVRACRGQAVPTNYARVGFVAENAEEARQALQICIDNLTGKPGEESWEHPKAVFYRKSGLDTTGKVVALFSGQGSQYLEMGRELANHFPVVREVFSAVDALFESDGLEPLSARVYPRPVFDGAARDALSQALTRTEHAQPAIGAISASLYKLLQQAGFKADFLAGHSFGELTALWAAGVIDEAGYYTLAKARGKAMAPPEDANFDTGTMTAVKGDAEKIRAALQDEPDVTLANWNANDQVVIAGTKVAVAKAEKKLTALGFKTIPLPVSAAFHTPLVSHAQEPFAQAIRSVKFHKPKTRVYSNNTAQPHASDPKEIQARLAEHILNPVLFRDEIENIYASGGTVFVEFGPKNVLTNLVSSILAGKPHLAVALNPSAKKDSDRQLREAVTALRVAGLPLENFDPYEAPRKISPPRKKSPVTIQLNAGYYVSPKTRAVFEKALTDGFKISLPAGSAPAAAPQAEPQPLQPVPAAEPLPVESPMQARALSQEEYTSMTATSSNAEQTLADYHTQQSETLRLHEQYLTVEEEYARAFAQMTNLQSALVSRLNAAPGEMQTLLPLFESLERSMNRFHDHQAETLRVHQRYLDAQEQFAQNIFTAGGSPSAAVVRQPVPVVSQPRAVAPPAVAAQPPVAPQPAVVRQPEVAVKPEVAKQPTVAAPPASVVSQPSVHSNGNGTHSAPAPAPIVETPVTAAHSTVDVAQLTAALLEIVSEKTGYPAETLELEMDMEADLGIDSIKRVEILGAMQEQFPELPTIEAAVLAELRTLGQITEAMGSVPAAAAAVQTPAVEATAPAPAAIPVQTAAAPGGITVQVVSAALLEIVSEKTGYPVETLELDMDMEADLGIDSIKRVEILGALQEQFPELPQADPAALAELRTLGDITNFLSSSPAAGSGSPSQEVTAQSPFELWGTVEDIYNPDISQGVVIRRILPSPDSIDFDLPEKHICLITDDGTALTPMLAQALLDRQWPVVVLRLPQAIMGETHALPEACNAVVLDDLSEAALDAQLTQIAANWGPVGVFIHLALTDANREEALYFSEAAKSQLKLVFLAAKHLKESLNKAARLGRAAFMTVTHLDGEFGLGEGTDYAPVFGGLFGLVKTLNLEWEAVFCRALDLSPRLDMDNVLECILAELHDPNRLIAEVGYTPTERSTLVIVSVPVTGGRQ